MKCGALWFTGEGLFSYTLQTKKKKKKKAAHENISPQKKRTQNRLNLRTEPGNQQQNA